MKNRYLIMFLGFIIAVLAIVNGCKKVDFVESTTTKVNILEYLQKDSTKRFTSLIDIINKTGYDPYLSAYGTITLFAPTNTAIDAYFKKIGKTVDQLTKAQLQDILLFHLLESVVTTSDFNDGKLSTQTLYGQFLITGVVNREGAALYQINRQALVTQPNILLGNGIIHVIDNVLEPSSLTIAKLIEQSPSDYSIFTEALKATGYYDTLNVTASADKTRKWFTLIATTNKTFVDSANIKSYADLYSRYCNTGNPKAATDSLHLYIAYHILNDIKYLADIVSASSHETYAPLEVITDKMVNKKVLINDDEYYTINGNVHEQGIELELSNSDVSASNGVLHRAIGNLAIKVRNPFPVYWDLCAQVPELTRLTSVYRKQTYLFDYGDSTNNTFKDIKWEKSCLKYRTGVKGYLGDYWQMGMGTSSSNTNSLGTCSGNKWIEFTTPLLVKGKYKVWFCYYTQNSTVSAVQGSFDSIPLTSGLIQFHQKISSVAVVDEASLEALGWKWWAGLSEKAGSTAGRMLGIIDVKNTGRHKIRFDLLSGQNGDCNFDMVHFIPLGMNQTSPRFNSNGTIEY